MPPPSIMKPKGLVRRTERATRVAAALMGALLTAGAGYLALGKPGKELVMLSYDLFYVVPRPTGTSEDLRIIYLVEAEKARDSADPLAKKEVDRAPQAKLLDKLGEMGARTVVYDLIFDQAKDPAVDLEFAAAIRRFRGVDADGNPLPGMPQRHVVLACGLENFSLAGVHVSQLHLPTDALLEAVGEDYGLVAWDDDQFGIRKLATGTSDDPSLIWKAAQLAGADLDENERMKSRWLNFAAPPKDPADPNSRGYFPAFFPDQVMSGTMSPELLRDKIVIVGGKPGFVGEALGGDLFSTPYNRFRSQGKLPLMSGVEVNANGLENLLHRNWLTRTSPDFELALVMVCGLLAGAGLTFLRPFPGICLAVVIVIGFCLTGVITMFFQQVWFPWTAVAFLQMPVALVWSVASNSYIDRFFRIKLTAEQLALRGAFEKYVSTEMLEQLTTEGFKVDLGGELVDAAMMFTDLECFTDLCNRVRDPQRIVVTLNDYFERTTCHIFEQDGIIIKYIGDAIFAAWGIPKPDPNAPVKAVRAAWNLFQSDKLVVDGEEHRTRIGLHFGQVVAGNIGSSWRVDYTLIGDAVNLSARLEDLNRNLGTNILLSEEIKSRLDGEFRTRRVGRFSVKGRKEYTVVHELLGPARQEQDPEWIGHYHEALTSLENNDRMNALRLFTAVDASRGERGDGPCRFFIDLLERGEPLVDGVVKMKEK